jgi:hypothetical protein
MKSTLLLALALLSTGCVHRSLTSVKDVGGSDTTLIETSDLFDAYVYKHVTHVFWQCKETGQTLTCERACGGTTDLTCPAADSLSVTSSNVR